MNQITSNRGGVVGGIIVAAALLALLPGLALAEQTGPARRVLAADYSGDRKRIAIVDAAGKIQWEHRINDIHDCHLLPDGHILFQTSWKKLVEVDKAGKIVWEYDAGTLNGNAGKPVEVHAFQRLEGGITMIAESGPARIIEVDKDGKLLKEIKLTVDKPSAHRDTRNARKLANGHYLVAQEGDGKVREYDGDGKVVWEYEAKTAVYSAIRLPNGNTLMGTGNGHSVVEVTPEKKIAWSVGEKDLPGMTLAWVTQVARLENGHTIIVNCHAGPKNPQIIEVDADKKVVWTFKDFDNFGNAMPAAQVLDIEGKMVR